jgi:DNA-binding NtrC family response regulator
MPEMNGEQLADAIQAIQSDMPIIMMTGFGDLMKAAGKMPPHISAILSKSFTLKNLRETLVEVIHG